MTLARLTMLVVIALLAASCSGNDKSSSSTTTTVGTTATTTGGTGGTGARPPATPPANAGMTVGKRDLSPLLAGSLARFVSKPVSANSATIVQLAGIDSFWAGKNGNQKVLVKVDLKGKRPIAWKVGQLVSFNGRVVKAPKSGEKLGVKGKTGGPVLKKQGAYILVPVNQLHLQ